MRTREERKLQARADALQAELDSRMSTSQKQAALVIRSDRRTRDVNEDRDDVEGDEPATERREPSASERQARRAIGSSSRWRSEESRPDELDREAWYRAIEQRERAEREAEARGEGRSS